MVSEILLKGHHVIILGREHSDNKQANRAAAKPEKMFPAADVLPHK